MIKKYIHIFQFHILLYIFKQWGSTKDKMNAFLLGWEKEAANLAIVREVIQRTQMEWTYQGFQYNKKEAHLCVQF